MRDSEVVVNPCRDHAFNVFQVDKSETNVRVVLQKIRHARDLLRYGRLRTREGRELSLSEADLNRMQADLLDPMKRLQTEQYVHQVHHFSQDEELLNGVAQLAKNRQDLLNIFLDYLQEALLHCSDELLRSLEPQTLADESRRFEDSGEASSRLSTPERQEEP